MHDGPATKQRNKSPIYTAQAQNLHANEPMYAYSIFIQRTYLDLYKDFSNVFY